MKKTKYIFLSALMILAVNNVNARSNVNFSLNIGTPAPAYVYETSSYYPARPVIVEEGYVQRPAYINNYSYQYVAYPSRDEEYRRRRWIERREARERENREYYRRQKERDNYYHEEYYRRRESNSYSSPSLIGAGI